MKISIVLVIVALLGVTSVASAQEPMEQPTISIVGTYTFQGQGANGAVLEGYVQIKPSASGEGYQVRWIYGETIESGEGLYVSGTFAARTKSGTYVYKVLENGTLAGLGYEGDKISREILTKVSADLLEFKLVPVPPTPKEPPSESPEGQEMPSAGEPVKV